MSQSNLADKQPGAEVLRGYPVRLRHLDIGGRRFELLGPDNYETLLDDPRVVKRFEQDEFMPYWAEFWPACLLLADEVAAWPAAAGSTPPVVLELGCGLGLAGLVAAARGCRVICSDYEDDALAFVRESARRNGLPEPETRFIDWRDTHSDLLLDRIIAAEVLYETRNLRPIAEFAFHHLKPDGFALIVDANRSTADAFDGIARACGLSVSCRPLQRPGDPQPIRGRLFHLARKAQATL